MLEDVPIFVLYQFPSFVIMTILFVTLVTTKNNHLQGAFFKLYASNILWEILWHLCADVLRLADYSDYAHSIPQVMIVCLFVCYCAYKVIVTGTLLIICNRYTAVVSPFSYEDMWSPRRVNIYIIGMYVICILFSAPVLFSEAFFAEIDGRLQFVGMTPDFDEVIRNVHLCYVTLVTFYGIPKSLLTIRAMAQNKVQKKYERTLVIVSAIDFSASFAVLGCHGWKLLTMFYGSSGPEDTVLAQQWLQIAMDVHFAISWLLIITFNQDVRKELRQTLKCRRNNVTEPTVQVCSVTTGHKRSM